MSGVLLFEQPQRNDVWRLEVCKYAGRTFLNWRKWYLKDNALKPTREGVTIPLERLSELEGALAAYRTGNASDGPPAVS